MKKRRYTKKLRAEQEDETRARIVAATVALHEQLGPAHTSIKAIADAAGVQRVTVYRHFPDDIVLFEACTSHYLGLHPPPDMTSWTDVADAGARSRAALLAFYRYYRGTAGMWRVAYRDVDEVAALRTPLERFEAYIDLVCDDLVGAWRRQRTARQRLRATLRHALRFSTWHSLEKANLDDAQMAELVLRWLQGIA
jgi:AcrR family transcriptional regulator